jgi:hypothetical protein
MELTEEHLESIKREAAEITWGKISICIAGPPSHVVDIISEKRVRFQSKAGPSFGKPTGQSGSGRY